MLDFSLNEKESQCRVLWRRMTFFFFFCYFKLNGLGKSMSRREDKETWYCPHRESVLVG